MTMHEYYIMTLKNLKDAINLAWGYGAETEKAEICDALQYAIERLTDETKH